MDNSIASRKERLCNAHPWLKDEQAHALLAHTYSKFHERYKGTDTHQLMENWVTINVKATEHQVRNQLAVAAEWCLF